MILQWIKLSVLCSVLLLCYFTHPTNSGAVHEMDTIVKKFYVRRQFPSFTTINSSLTPVNHHLVRSKHPQQMSYISGADERFNPISPKFIKRAQFMPGNSIFPQNSRYWSHSTTFSRSPTEQTQQKVDKINNSPTIHGSTNTRLINPINHLTDDGTHSLVLSDQNKAEQEFHIEADDENEEDDIYGLHPQAEQSNYMPNEINRNKYKVVITAQMDSPFSNDEADLVRGYQPNWAKEPRVLDETNDYLKYTTEKQQPFEPAHLVYRSTVPWARRDTQRLGQPTQLACNQLLDRGVGPDEVSSWYYDTMDGRCRWFGYRGYGGNANRFYSRAACESLCIHDTKNLCESVRCLWPQTSCTLVGDQSCKDYKRLREKSWEAECPPDQPVCLSRRNTRMAPDIDFTNIPAECRQGSDAGSCYIKNPSVNFFYDVSRNDCMAFYFHECGGNDNRFQTKSECMTHCSP